MPHVAPRSQPLSSVTAPLCYDRLGQLYGDATKLAERGRNTYISPTRRNAELVRRVEGLAVRAKSQVRRCDRVAVSGSQHRSMLHMMHASHR